MRLVAVATMLLAGLALLPGVPAVNECQDPCQTIVVPRTAPATDGTTYYLYVQGAQCVPPAEGECAHQPRARVAGVLYEEANCVSGLQRYPGKDCFGATDRMVLL